MDPAPTAATSFRNATITLPQFVYHHADATGRKKKKKKKPKVKKSSAGGGGGKKGTVRKDV